MGLEQLGNQFAKGDRHARRDVFMFAEKLGVDLLAGARSTIEALAPDHQAILDAYVDRRTGNANGGSAAPVIAPPELLDDDATVSQSTPDPTASPAPTEPAPAKLPRTPQEIREARRLRFQKQAQFDAARAAELAAALCEPDTATKELPTSEPPVTPPPATAADSVVEPAPAPPAAPSTVTNASGAAPQGSSVEAKPPLAAPAIQLPDSVSTNPPPASEVPAPPTSPLDASPPDAPPPDPPPSVMQNPWRQGRKPTEKEKIDWALHINNRSAR